LGSNERFGNRGKWFGVVAGATFAVLGGTAASVVLAQEKAEKPVVREKTPEQIDVILKGIKKNRLLGLLEPAQQAAMAANMRSVEFQPGEIVLREGELGNLFYIVEEGETEAIGKGGVSMQTFRRGESFGEGAFVLFTKRSASVRAKTRTKVWIIDRTTFNDHVLPTSERLQRVFKQFATLVDPKDGSLRMSHRDFLRSLGLDAQPAAGQAHEAEFGSRLKFVFELADKDKSGSLDFAEFALFELLLSRPDAELELAFRLFDENNNGQIGQEDVLRVLKSSSDSNFKFNANCSLMQRFFGAKGTRKLNPAEFQQFFLNLTEEIPRQLFEHYDSKSTGFLNQDQFSQLLHDLGFGAWRLPPGVLTRLMDVKCLVPNRTIITYPEFIAFNNFLNHLPAVEKLVNRECKMKDGPITKEEFKWAVMNSVGNNVSPLEVDVIFNIFDTNKDGKIDLQDFQCVVNYGRDCRPEEYQRILDRQSGKPVPLSGQPIPESMSPLAVITEFVQHFGLGAIAGGIGAFAVFPIDLVKTRMQNQRAVDPSKRLYKNSFDCFAKVIRNEGVLGLYRGLLPQLMGVAPEKAIKLTVNDMLRKWFKDPERGQIYFPLEVLAGCGAGASQVIFTNPIEIVKIRLQVMGESIRLDPSFKPKSTITIVKELGLSGLYKGAGACLLRDIPFSGIYFPVYAGTKKWLADENGKNTPMQLLGAGALAGVPAAALVTPADVIKTRLQVEARKGEATYSGIRDCAIKVYQAEGFRAFWKGAPARVFRSSPQFGITLLSYEMLQRYLAPEIEPRPPTNAPVTVSDFDTLRLERAATQIRNLEERLRQLGTK
jgi:solute carrier family 25 aspartate/glutamate transporter 12/13